jgi:hypothetical protein
MITSSNERGIYQSGKLSKGDASANEPRRNKTYASNQKGPQA